MERVLRRRSDEDGADESAEEEEDSGGISARLNNLRIETAGTEDEAAEGLAASLEMEVEEDRGSKGEEEGEETTRALGAFSSSLRKPVKAEPRSLMPVMGSTI